MELVDTLAVVTGGGGGLGEVLVVELARLGCDVVIADRDIDSAARVAALVGKLHTCGGFEAQAPARLHTSPTGWAQP